MKTVIKTITIKIQRVGHFYYYWRWEGEQLVVECSKINRETADMVIRTNTNGLIPEGVNLDVVKPRNWVWQKEITDV